MEWNFSRKDTPNTMLNIYAYAMWTRWPVRGYWRIAAYCYAEVLYHALQFLRLVSSSLRHCHYEYLEFRQRLQSGDLDLDVLSF